MDPENFRDPLFALDGRSIIVAGAASGLGQALATALARRGALVTLADRDAARLEAVRTQIGGSAIAVAGDATDEGDAARFVGAARSAFGHFDGLVNSVGIFRIGPALELPLADFRATLDVNVTAALVLSRAAAKGMEGSGGRIVHLASVSSLVANPQYAAYATSKAALAHLVRVLAREWAPRAITVNAIGPAMTETPLSVGHMADPEFRAAALSVIPLGRFGEADDLIGTLVLLLSDAGRFITGQTIYVDGGRTLV